MTRMSKEAERTVLAAIETVIDHVNDGLSPTAAVEKVARDEGLNHNFVQLVCTGYNTGATNFQREHADDVTSKFASFPIADAAEVTRRIWPQEVTSPAAEKEASIVSDEYSLPPRSTASRQTESLTKLAEADASRLCSEKPKPAPRSSAERAKRAFNWLEFERRKLEVQRSKCAEAQHNLLSLLGQLREWTKTASPAALTELDYVAHETYGDAGKYITSYVRGRTKQAAVAPALPKQVNRINWRAEPYSLLQQCHDTAKLAAEEKSEYVKQAAAVEKEAADRLSPFGLTKSQSRVETTPSPTSPKRSKQGGFLSGMALGTASRGLSGALVGQDDEAKARSESMAADLSDPVHENELRKIQTQSILQDLMLNDEVVSGYDPDEVLNAFNEMSSLSPHGATQMAIVRPWLRKRLSQGAIEPFEAAEMANVEKTLNDTSGGLTTTSTPKAANVLERKQSILAR